MERVTGIGGVFFRAEDPEALNAWYAEHLWAVGGPTTEGVWQHEAGLNIDYAGSPAVLGDANTQLAPGQRVPHTIAVRPSGCAPCGVHEAVTPS